MPTLNKIIYVDDQMDILLVAEYALTEIGGFDTLMCDNGFDALKKIKKFQPDLVVLDVMMPEIDGPQTLAKIREIKEFTNTPALFVTAKIFPDEIAELSYCNTNVLGVIAKPFDPTKISDQIESLWQTSVLGKNGNLL